MSRTKWAVLALGLAMFLSAFGIALALTVFQISREIPSTLRVSSTVVLSGDNLRLWHDRGRIQSVTSLEYFALRFQPPLEGIFSPEIDIYVENMSTVNLALIAPCHDVESPPGTVIGHVAADLVDIRSGADRGSTCDPQALIAPREIVRARIHLDLEPGVGDGEYSFNTLFGAVSIPGDGPISPPDGMVGWWPGDGNSLDIVGGNHGTLSGDATYSGGMVGQAFSLDGSGDFVVVPDDPSLNITGDVTVDLWAKRNSFDSADLVLKGAGLIGTSDPPTAYSLFFIFDDRIAGFFERADGSDVVLIGDIRRADRDTEYHHYAYVRSGDTHSLFMDGRLAAFQAFTGSPGDTSGLPLMFGSSAGDVTTGETPAHFDGAIDEVEVFNRALTQAEIIDIFEAGSLGKLKPAVPNSSMVHWWSFDEGTGDTAHDIVDGSDGTLRNGPTWTTGMVDGALHLDGDDDYVEAPNTLPATMDEISVEAWVNFDSLRELFGGGVRSNALVAEQSWWHDKKGFSLETNGTSDSNPREHHFSFSLFAAQGGGGPVGCTIWGPVLAMTGQWYHVVGTYDGSFVRVYVNGAPAGRAPCTGALLINNNRPLWIGKDDIDDGKTHGTIDEVSIYDTALTLEEIRAIYMAGSAGKLRPQMIFRAPPGFEHLGQVVFGSNGRFFVPTSATMDGTIAAVLTNPATPGGNLEIYGTVPPGGSHYSIGATNLTVGPDGKIFLNTLFGGLLTDPETPGGPLSVWGTPPGNNGRLYQFSPAFDATGRLFVGGRGDSGPGLILTNPSTAGGTLSTFGSVPGGYSGRPGVTPGGTVFVEHSSPSRRVLTSPTVPGGAFTPFGVYPDGVLLIASGVGVHPNGALLTLGVESSTSTGIVLTDPVTTGGELRVFGRAPTGTTLTATPLVADDGTLYVGDVPGTSLFTNPDSFGGALNVLGIPPPGFIVQFAGQGALTRLSPEGRILIWGYNATSGEFAVFTDPTVPGGEMTPVALFSGATRMGYPSVDEWGNAYVSVMYPDRPPEVRKVPR